MKKLLRVTFRSNACHTPTFNDELLSEFSSCDIRAITYLSFYKYIENEIKSSIIVTRQYLERGKTTFLFFDKISNEYFEKDAISDLPGFLEVSVRSLQFFREPLVKLSSYFKESIWFQKKGKFTLRIKSKLIQ